MSYTVFVTGTDTDVGKTYVAAMLTAGLRHHYQTVGVYKPVASGCIRAANGDLIATDAQRLWQAAGRPRTLDDVCPQRFLSALAPPLAAIADGKNVDEAQLVNGLEVWKNCDVAVIEGAGGLFSPISERLLNIDLIERLAADEVWLVAADRIGVVHQVLVCIQAAKSRGIPITTIVLNQMDDSDISVNTNAELIRKHTDVPIKVRIRPGQTTWPTEKGLNRSAGHPVRQSRP